LINKDKAELMKLLEQFKFTGRGVEDGLLEGLALADERIEDLKFNKTLKEEDKVLKIEDIKAAFENIERNDAAASISSLKPPSKLDILKGFLNPDENKKAPDETPKPEQKPAGGFLNSLFEMFKPMAKAA
jgi:hypothetical protein